MMSPGTYIRLRREAAKLSIDDVALMTETIPPVCARSRAEWFDLVEQDRTPVTADVVETLAGAFPFDRHVLVVLVALHAGAAVDAPQVCRLCACSWSDPCLDSDDVGCAWAEPDLCTTCVPALAAGAAA